MSMITELFGEEILQESLLSVKQRIKSLPDVQNERYSYLLHDWAAATGRKLTYQDYLDVEKYPAQ